MVSDCVATKLASSTLIDVYLHQIHEVSRHIFTFDLFD